MSQSAGVEELYRNFGILADAGESMSEVRGGRGGITCKTPAHSIITPPPVITPPLPLLHPQHASAYEGIIKAAKGSLGEKKLAAGFITRFFQHFPALAENAMDAMLDLIEDEDAQVNTLGSKSFCTKTSSRCTADSMWGRGELKIRKAVMVE